MNESDWKNFLTEFNGELLSYEEVVEALPREVIKSGWVGYAGASESEVSKAEERLGAVLPSSFRAFLKTTNGWRFPSPSVSELLPVSKIAWFREENQDWIDVWNDPSRYMPIPDENYFVYGNKQSSLDVRTEYMEYALQVSDVFNGAVVLLNPRVVTPDGEWYRNAPGSQFAKNQVSRVRRTGRPLARSRNGASRSANG